MSDPNDSLRKRSPARTGAEWLAVLGALVLVAVPLRGAGVAPRGRILTPPPANAFGILPQLLLGEAGRPRGSGRPELGPVGRGDSVIRGRVPGTTPGSASPPAAASEGATNAAPAKDGPDSSPAGQATVSTLAPRSDPPPASVIHVAPCQTSSP